MKKYIFLFALAVSLMFSTAWSPPAADAQVMEVNLSALAPQNVDTDDLTIETFGFGVGVTYVYTQANDYVHIVGELKYHVHDRIITKNRDILLGAGIRLTALGLYGQAVLSAIEKRDQQNLSKAREDTVAGTLTAGYNLKNIGVHGSYFISDLGNHYGVGLAYRF